MGHVPNAVNVNAIIEHNDSLGGYQNQGRIIQKLKEPRLSGFWAETSQMRQKHLKGRSSHVAQHEAHRHISFSQCLSQSLPGTERNKKLDSNRWQKG